MAEKQTAPNGRGMSHRFQLFAANCAAVMGTRWAFLTALLVLVVWLAAGPYFHFSDTWQLIINTATTVVTFLMVFVIQNTQNRDARAIHLKLDEIIRSIQRAHNDMINIETLPDEELEELAKQYERFRKEYEQRKRRAA